MRYLTAIMDTVRQSTEKPDQSTAPKKHRRLGTTILFWFLILALVPLHFVSYLSYNSARSNLSKNAEKALVTVAGLKTEYIKAFFDEIFTDLAFQAQSPTSASFLTNLIAAYRDSDLPLLDFTQSFTWLTLVDKSGGDLMTFNRVYGYYDLYLIDTKGNILFSATGDQYLGTNLMNGPYSSSRFAVSCRQALQTRTATFSDYELVDENLVTGVAVAPLVDSFDDMIGLMALRFSLDPIDAIMQSSSHLGNSAETYLVGPDLKLRSNSVLSEEKTVLKEPLNTARADFIKEQLRFGNEAAYVYPAELYAGPHGKDVLGIHRNFTIKGVHFAVVAEITQEEAFQDAARLRQVFLLVLMLTGLLVTIIALLLSNRIVKPLQQLTEIAGRIAGGDLDQTITTSAGNEIGVLADSFNNMLANLRRTTDEVRSTDWLKNGQAAINNLLRGEPDSITLSRNIVSFLTPHLGCQVGLFYIYNTDRSFHLSGSYGFNSSQIDKQDLYPGEGLTGQVIVEKKAIHLTRCPTDYLLIHSSLGSTPAREVLIYPFIDNDQVRGIIEIGTKDSLSPSHLKFLDEVNQTIAIAINSLRSRQKNAELLITTQQQAEELQSREEELRAGNHELAEQAKMLKESEVRLKIQQEELQATNEELEEKGASLIEKRKETEEKNRQLEEAREIIEQKVRDLEQANLYKSEFLANMSHELRTPLNSILLLSKVLSENQKQSLNDDDVESIKTIYSSGSDLLQLINEILDLAKVEAGKLDVTVEPIALADFLHDIHRTFKPMTDDRDLEFLVLTDENLPLTISTDRKRLYQVLKNFLANSLKFTTSGRITLHAHRPDQQTGEPGQPQNICFSVIDTGIGIPPEKQQLIFEAFQQADGSTSRKYGGTGLGLSISRELALLLGGHITLHSIPNAGSTFCLHIPENFMPAEQEKIFGARPPESQTAPAVSVTRKAAGIPPPIFPAAGPILPSIPPKTPVDDVRDDRENIFPQDKLLLVIEDDANFSRILRNLARECGFKVILAADGKTGLQFAEFHAPSAILLDIGLPGLDGWTVMSRLKENSRTRHIPVHFLSGTDRPNDGLRMGAVGFLTKPVQPEQLAEMFKRMENFIAKKVRDLLIVQSDPAEQQAIENHLGKSADLRITRVFTAEETLQIIHSREFDAILLDPQLPDRSGLELLQEIKNIDGFAELPVIVYTDLKLTDREREMVDRYSVAAIMKDGDSQRRLLDETTLFLHRVEENLPEQQRKMLKIMHNPEEVFKHKKILLVDDDMRNVFSLKRILTDRQVEVLAGKNGQDAILRLQENPDIDLVLMDIMMPVMDGYEAIRTIRRNPCYEKLPIIALTAKAMKGDRAKCIEAGASDYLAKPVDPDRLLSMLRVWLY